MTTGQASAGPAESASYHGCVDSWDGARIRGWVRNPNQPASRLEIEVLQGGQCILVLRADRYRADLANAGFGDGCYAFDFPLPVALFNAPTVVLQIRTREGEYELAGSPISAENHSASLDQVTLSALGQRIAAAADTAQTPHALDTLHHWLQHHHDLVSNRQAALERAAAQKDTWFADILARTGALPDLLQGAARAVVAQYDTLHIESVEHPDVTVIIPAYNNFHYTYRCVQSLVTLGAHASFEVIVLDDASADETLFAGFVMFGGIRIVRNTRNLGFLNAVNAAARLARGRLLFLLNNDTEVQDGWLDALVQTFARDPAIGIAGSKLIYPDGSLQEAGGIVWRDGSAMNWGNGGDPHDPRYCFMRDADYVSGAALMIERSVFEAVGGLSEAFAPAYYEDTDLCFKVRAMGRRVVLQPQSRIVHHEGVTSGTDVGGSGIKRYQRINHRTFTLKWIDALQHHGPSDAPPERESERGVTKRALFIDDTAPTPDQDAGSNVAVSYMLGLQRIGFKVSFAGANLSNIPRYTSRLEALGIRCYYSPYTRSIGDILNDDSAAFDVFYIHRFSNMRSFLPLVRERFPQAHIVYCVADLHHLRHEREAALKNDETIQHQAKELKQAELAMVKAADAVIMHSSFERDLIKAFDPAVNAYAIPWTVAAQPAQTPFAERAGIAFIGGYNHPPNVDAVFWLVETILPLVHEQDPAIECLLIGSQMPDKVRALERPGVRIVGHLEVLQPTLDRLRLTVAPLRYGAGMKGKVLTSLAAGLPCVATLCAVEGMELPDALDAVVADTAESLAERILSAYRDEALNTTLSQAGLAYIASRCSFEHVDALLRAASAPPGVKTSQTQRPLARPRIPRASATRKPAPVCASEPPSPS
jgi:GT2 family glycosyltransferase